LNFDIIYSLDKVRLKGKMPNNQYRELLQNKLDLGLDVMYYEKRKIASMRHNFRITIDENKSFYFGICQNNFDNVNNSIMAIEFNPNKINLGEPQLLSWLQYFDLSNGLGNSIHDDDFIHHTKLQLCDIACDIKGIIPSDLIVDSHKQTQKHLYYGKNQTYYLGLKEGREKIYDKGIERGLKDMKMTRYEITVYPKHAVHNINDIELDLDRHMSKLFTNKPIVDKLDLKPTDSAIIFAVLNGYPIKSLNQRKRAMVKEILGEDNQIHLDKKKMHECIFNFCDELKEVI